MAFGELSVSLTAAEFELEVPDSTAESPPQVGDPAGTDDQEHDEEDEQDLE